jgi:hypothetical protein
MKGLSVRHVHPLSLIIKIVVDVKNGPLYMRIRLTSLAKGGAELSGAKGRSSFQC